MHKAHVSARIAQKQQHMLVTLQHKANTLQVQVSNNYRTPREILQADKAKLYGNWLWEWRNGEGSVNERIVYNGVAAQ
jgi:hypothetical protein